jgi:hypothetical protein
MTLISTVTEGLVDMISPDAFEVAISPSYHVQVLQDVRDLAHARKAQGAAFVLSEKCVVIWSDEAEGLLQDAQRVHEQLAQFLWAVAGCAAPGQDPRSNYFSLSPREGVASQTPPESLAGHFSSPGLSDFPSTESGINLPGLASSSSHGQLVIGGAVSNEKVEDVEAGMDLGYEERPTMVISAIGHGLACALALVISVLQVRTALIWSLLDGNWARMAVAVVCPLYFIVVMFLCDNIISILFQLFGPVRQLHQNSRYFSGIKPKPLGGGNPLPHITIQMPVYKEDFAFVLKPSFESIKKAIRTYELQGGSASIIVGEDGIVLVDQAERMARLEYYEDNNITWIGRPKHGKDGFVREGRFKKASNLNFTYDVLLKTEQLMEQRRDPTTGGFEGDQIESAVYNTCLQEVLADTHPDACGSGLDKFGELILLIDSDTRVPVDCFLDAATEMTRSKDVGILQHCSGVMLVSTSFFERCIAFFTRLVNFSISFAIANGHVAPFMGHNAYLRWSAMKEISKIVTLPNGKQQLKIWSEDHVSEDFVMALDMIEHGYITRWATYSNSEYMEGVSLSCDDELNRWQKYAWGVSEMVFNPIKHWYRGPITPLFRRFIFGKAPIHYKWASCSYCFSYYAIALAFPLTLGLALVQGWLGRNVEAPFIPSFEVMVACLVIFNAGSTFSLAYVRFRAGVGNILKLLLENVTFLPFLLVFFAGLSFHVSTALLSHLLGINMTWGATLKDIEMTNFFAEAPVIIKRHWRLFTLCLLIIAGMAILSTDVVPLEWRLEGFFVVFPGFFIYSMHLLFPILLNPNLLRFSF